MKMKMTFETSCRSLHSICSQIIDSLFQGALSPLSRQLISELLPQQPISELLLQLQPSLGILPRRASFPLPPVQIVFTSRHLQPPISIFLLPLPLGAFHLPRLRVVHVQLQLQRLLLLQFSGAMPQLRLQVFSARTRLQLQVSGAQTRLRPQASGARPRLRPQLKAYGIRPQLRASNALPQPPQFISPTFRLPRYAFESPVQD